MAAAEVASAKALGTELEKAQEKRAAAAERLAAAVEARAVPPAPGQNTDRENLTAEGLSSYRKEP